MIRVAQGNVCRLSKTIRKRHRGPMLLFATRLSEICALFSNDRAIDREASA